MWHKIGTRIHIIHWQPKKKKKKKKHQKNETKWKNVRKKQQKITLKIVSKVWARLMNCNIYGRGTLTHPTVTQPYQMKNLIERITKSSGNQPADHENSKHFKFNIAEKQKSSKYRVCTALALKYMERWFFFFSFFKKKTLVGGYWLNILFFMQQSIILWVTRMLRFLWIIDGNESLYFFCLCLLFDLLL